MSYGTQGHLGISAQQSFKTATASFDYIPIISETLTTEIEQLMEEGMKGRFEEGNGHAGLLTVAGDIVFEPHPILMGHMLRGVTGQASGTLTNSAYNWEFLPVQADFSAGCALPPFTLEVYRDNGSAWQFTDAIINALSVEIAGGTIIKATASVLARVSSLATKTTPAFPEGDPLDWDATSVSIAGAANGDLESAVLTIDNAVEGVGFLDTTKMHGKYLRSGLRTFGLSGTMDFCDQVQYGKFRDQTEQRFIFTITGPTVAQSYTNDTVFDMPKLRYTTFPVNMPGPGRISVGFEGNAKYDTTSSYAFRATMVNTRATYEN